MNPPQPESSGKIRLSGTIAGVEACLLVTDQALFSVGSGLTRDLCVLDPLLPDEAFRIYRDTQNEGNWILEASSGSRLYLNNELTLRDRLHFGDQIHAGCHRFRFEKCPDLGRNYRTNAQISDVCNHLLSQTDVPAGYLKSTPGHLNRRRYRQAATLGGGVLLILAALMLLTPRQELFEQIQPPLEIVMISSRALTPKPDAIKLLKNVQRRMIKDPTPAPVDPELKPVNPPAPETREMAEPKPLTEPAPVVAPNVDFPKPKVELGALTADPISLKSASRSQVQRKIRALDRTASVQRLNTPLRTNTGGTPVEIADKMVPVEPVTNRFKAAKVQQIEEGGKMEPAKPSISVGTSANAAQVAALLKYQPSAVTFEKVSGSRIPVARLPAALNQVEVPGSDAAIVLDGEVSEAEIAMCWKSGQFRRHAPGTPPPLGDPPTYCYVGKAAIDTVQHLYISFICIDPDVDRIIAKWNGAWGNPPGVTWDDSVEIFLDTNGDRNDYHQMIVNTRGQYWAAYYPNSRADGSPQVWSGVHPKIKTTINREAKRWTCEIFIPFAELGGEPRKGMRWSVNFCRNFRGQYAPNSNLQNWFLVYKDEQYFLKPNLFGVFEW